MLSVFATQRDREFNVAELARQAGISRKTAYDHIDDLAELGVVREREVSQGKRYSYNTDSDVARKLYELNGATLRRRQELRDDVEAPDR
jgi:DNA-binding IclR family transcriptional regulator